MDNFFKDNAAAIWFITLIFTVGAQYGLYRAFKNSVRDKFNQMANRISRVEKSQDDFSHDLRESEKSIAVIEEKVTQFQSNFAEFKTDSKEAFKKLTDSIEKVLEKLS